MLRWQTVADVDFRTLFFESISSKGMHTALARMGWKLDGVFPDTAKSEVSQICDELAIGY